MIKRYHSRYAAFLGRPTHFVFYTDAEGHSCSREEIDEEAEMAQRQAEDETGRQQSRYHNPTLRVKKHSRR
jgi:hypothetical protein